MEANQRRRHRQERRTPRLEISGPRALPEQEQDTSDETTQTMPDNQAPAMLEPGSYSDGAFSMVLKDDGRFTLTNADGGNEAIGRYEATDGQITLSDAEGDVGTTVFPMTCGVQRAETGFSIEQINDAVCPLAGLELQAQ